MFSQDMIDTLMGDYWPRRIMSQWLYARELSEICGGQYDQVLDDVERFITAKYQEEGAVTRITAQEAEQRLSGQIGDKAKEYSVICVSHAHIDMNWKWRFDETVAITLETFQTMLDLMGEYPEFTFSQSQASVYQIVEKYDPEMLQEIKQRVREGRWEVTASTWVEADKNLPTGESMARQLLYTKKYLAKLFDIDPDSLNLDFEPDTFGHSRHVSEILSDGGVKYYYHCRGYDGHNLYRWKAPSGRSVIAYREQHWYNSTVGPDMAVHVPAFCQKHNIKSMMRVYGVGDHGGGPTRRDLECIRDMNNWPVFPIFKFGTYKEFFSLVEKVADALPVVEGELNFMCTGCYTSQSRIKAANRIAEGALGESETFSAAAAMTSGKVYPAEDFAKAWQSVLFNQFHDILPGSGTVDTREHAMGLFQNAMAVAESARTQALKDISKHINTANLTSEDSIKDSTSEGAGVGFGVSEFRPSQVSRGAGKTRIFGIFNSSFVRRMETVEIVVWDWPGDLNRLIVEDAVGSKIPHQILDNGLNVYWGHHFVRILVDADVPACGYSTYVVKESEETAWVKNVVEYQRLEKAVQFVMENSHLRAEFDKRTGALISLVDKETNCDLIEGGQGGVFRLIKEDDSRGMTSWFVGRYTSVQGLVDEVKIQNVEYSSTDIRQSISYNIKFSSSYLEVMVSLDRNSHLLTYDVKCNWYERGESGRGIPQLDYFLPLNYDCDLYRYDVPFGTIEREPLDLDVPSNGWAMAINNNVENKSLLMMARTKYGFRGFQNGLSLSLIRSSYDPDPAPELGAHQFSFAVGIVDTKSSNKHLLETAYAFNHPLSALSVKPRKGSLPATHSFMQIVTGSAVISALKCPEDGDNGSIIVRLYETDGKDTSVTLAFNQVVKDAMHVDVHEAPVGGKQPVRINENEIIAELEPYSVTSLQVRLM